MLQHFKNSDVCRERALNTFPCRHIHQNTPQRVTDKHVLETHLPATPDPQPTERGQGSNPGPHGYELGTLTAEPGQERLETRLLTLMCVRDKVESEFTLSNNKRGGCKRPGPPYGEERSPNYPQGPLQVRVWEAVSLLCSVLRMVQHFSLDRCPWHNKLMGALLRRWPEGGQGRGARAEKEDLV